MNRLFLAFVFFAAATAALAAQAGQSNPYQGTSNPPPDDTILTDTGETQAKPPAGQPINARPAAAPTQTQTAQAPALMAQPIQMGTPANAAQPAVTGTDDGIVQVAAPAPTSARPDLSRRDPANDPDGDIVHPAALPPGTLAEGTMIRVRLLNDLSSSFSQKDEPFRSRVATDVLQGGNVVIPAGSEISGKVVDVSTGHFGGVGTLLLRPDTVTLPDGQSYKLHAMVASTPGSNLRVEEEGVIAPGSQMKKDLFEYGGVVGGGAATGAILGGPVGALAGTIVGAGVVTTHLLVSHPQTHLDSGSVLMLTLTERTHLEPAHAAGD